MCTVVAPPTLLISYSLNLSISFIHNIRWHHRPAARRNIEQRHLAQAHQTAVDRVAVEDEGVRVPPAAG